MTPHEIRTAISADPALVTLAHSGDTQAIADALTGTTTEVVDRHGGIGMVMEHLGPDAGAASLDSLEALKASVPKVKWAFYLIEKDELNFGSANVRQMIDEMTTQNVWSSAIGTLLKDIAVQPIKVTEFQVRQAIYADTGEVLV